MRKLLIALTLPFVLVLAACDTAPDDGTDVDVVTPAPAPDAMAPAPAPAPEAEPAPALQ